MIWWIAIASIAGVLFRPFKTPEWVWAVAGAALLLSLRLVSWTDGWLAFRQGFDVYFFLIAMMLLSELARREGLFDWLAGQAAEHARSSALRLFFLIYGAGVLVTMFLSNDATAVVLTPAVYAAAKKVGAKPTAYLFACAFVANAASFLLPISNPANLVFFEGQTPAIEAWALRFGLASIASIVATALVLWFWFRADLHMKLSRSSGETKLESGSSRLSTSAKWTAAGLGLVVVVMLTASHLNQEFGAPALIASVAIAAGICLGKKEGPSGLIREIAWGVIPLVAGLFIIVAGLNRAGATDEVATLFTRFGELPKMLGVQAGAFAVGLASNLFNNLPVGLIAGAAVQKAQVAREIKDAVLIGVDLGPNLSVTGSLATILWLMAIRREGEHVRGWDFLKVGLLAMPISLALAILCLR